jgi:hypothetical protein
MRVFACAGAVLFALLSVPAWAQEREPLPIAAADLRFFYSGLGQDPVTAADLGVAADALPSRGLGGVAGVHVYPLRGRTMALGIGGEWLIARGVATPADPATGVASGPRIEQRLISLSPQISLNFGHREGWSYVTAGMGPLSFETFQGDLPPHDLPPKSTTLNYGGGARWFAKAHLAFSFDIRFYRTPGVAAVGPAPGRQANRLLVMSAGIAFK